MGVMDFITQSDVMSPTLPHLALREPSSLEPKEEHDRTARTVTLCGVRLGRCIPWRAL